MRVLSVHKVVVGLVVAAATLFAAPAAQAHGSCTTTAYPPTSGGNTVSGKTTFRCTNYHTNAKLEVESCLDWQDVNGSFQYVCQYAWAWGGSHLAVSVTVNVGCPTVPTWYSTYGAGDVYHTDTFTYNHYSSDTSPGVLVNPVTCTVLPQIACDLCDGLPIGARTGGVESRPARVAR